MGYCSLAEAKEVLQIDVSETSWDNEITICITSADGLIDSILKYWDFSVPLSSPYPQNIIDASKYFTAWLFKQRRDPAGAPDFWEEGNRFLQAYIDAEKRQPYFGRA